VPGVSITPPELRGAPLVVKSTGKISALRSRAADQLVAAGCSGSATGPAHVGIGHTRWATVRDQIQGRCAVVNMWYADGAALC